MFETHRRVIAKVCEQRRRWTSQDFATTMGVMSTQKRLTRHGALLDEARQLAGLSQREAARRAGISEGRWRQIVTGYQKSGGVEIPVNTKPETLLMMARAVDADPSAVFVAAGLNPFMAEDEGVVAAADAAAPSLESRDVSTLVYRVDNHEQLLSDLGRRVAELESTIEQLTGATGHARGDYGIAARRGQSKGQQARKGQDSAAEGSQDDGGMEPA